MSNNTVIQQQPRIRRTISCSFCNVLGHSIQKCNSPVVIQFYDDAIAKASENIQESVFALKTQEPFVSATIGVLNAAVSNRKLASVSVLNNKDYLIHILSFYYWNKYNINGVYVNERSLIQSAKDETMVMYELVLEREETIRRIQADELQQLLQQRNRAQERRQFENELAEIEARQSIQESIPCMCCRSTQHIISDCNNKTVKHLFVQIIILSINISTQIEFKHQLQQHPNLYVWIVIAIRHFNVSIDCRDAVFAINKIVKGLYNITPRNSSIKIYQLRELMNEYKISFINYDSGSIQPLIYMYHPHHILLERIMRFSSSIQLFKEGYDSYECYQVYNTIIQQDIYIPNELLLEYKVEQYNIHNKSQEREQCSVCFDCDEDVIHPLVSFGCNHEMCSKCVNLFFKNKKPNNIQHTCHLCRKTINNIVIPSFINKTDLFKDICVKVIHITSSDTRGGCGESESGEVYIIADTISGGGEAGGGEAGGHTTLARRLMEAHSEYYTS